MTSLVSDYMNARMISCGSKANVRDVANTMTQWNISSVAIVDEKNDKVIGILTERDIVRYLAKGAPSGPTAVALMSTPVVSVRSDLSIDQAARLMLTKNIRHLIVEDDSRRVKGIITTTDLARYFKQRTTGPARTESNDPDPLLSEVWELYF
jgi:CBS domain-containing protein